MFEFNLLNERERHILSLPSPCLEKVPKADEVVLTVCRKVEVIRGF